MFTLTFSKEEMEILDNALGQMPYKMVAPLIANINEQIRNNNTVQGVKGNTNTSANTE